MQKKLIAIVVALAMLLSTFGVIAPVFAADATTISDVTWGDAPEYPDGASTLEFTVAVGAGGDSVNSFKVDVGDFDYADGDFTVSGGAWDDGAGAVDGVVTFSGDALDATDSVTVTMDLTNPADKGTYPIKIEAGAAKKTVNCKVVWEYEATVDKDEILTGTTTNVKISIKNDGLANSDDAYYAIYEDEDGDGIGQADEMAYTGYCGSSSFTYSFNTDIYHNFKYIVVVDDAEFDDDPVTGDESDDYPDGAQAVITTKHKMTLNVPTIKAGDTKTITGTVKDGSGDTLEVRPTIKLYKSGSTTALASARASSNGSFSLAANFDVAGKYIVRLFEDASDTNTIEYDSFTVGADEGLKVTVDKSTVITGKEVTIVVTVKDGSTPKNGAVVQISGIKADVETANGFYAGDEEELTKLYAVTGVDGKATIKATYTKSGTATVKAMWDENETIANIDDAVDAFDEDNVDEFDYKGEGSFKVGKPNSFNISVSDEEVDAVVPFNLTVEFWDKDSAGITADGIEKVEITVEGCGVDLDEDDVEPADYETGDAANVGSFLFRDVVPECGGEIVVTAVATFDDGDEVTATEKIEVDGWKVTVTPTVATIDKEYTFKATVTKADGTAVNNAIVWLKVEDGYAWNDVDFDAEEYDDDDEDWVDFEQIDGSDTNINNGVYEKKVKFTEVGDVTVLVTNAVLDGFNDYTPKAYVEVEVEGEDVYEVDAPAKLVAGLEETIEFTVKDEDGDEVEDDDAYVTIDGDDYELDLDDGVYSFDFVHDDVEELTLVFKTDGGELIGKASIEVVAPKLKLKYDDTKLTYMVEEAWTLELIDPRDDSVIEDAILYITPDNCILEIDGEEWDDETNEIDLGNGEAEFDIFAYEQDDDDDPMMLTFEVSIDDGPKVEVAEIEVVDLSIAASPAKIGVDVVSTVTITVLDAHGKPYAEKDVELSGPLTAESETDADGKVTFKIKPTSTGKITISVETDDEDAEGKIDVVLDAAGAGKIQMQLGNKTAVANGVMSTLDVAPFAENGRTFVPFRYLGEAIGAYVEFIAPDKIVYRLRKDATTVDEVWLTIGSNVASVNGVEVALDAPARIVNGRTMVPLRFVGEAFGFYVDYNFASETITLTK